MNDAGEVLLTLYEAIDSVAQVGGVVGPGFDVDAGSGRKGGFAQVMQLVRWESRSTPASTCNRNDASKWEQGERCK